MPKRSRRWATQSGDSFILTSTNLTKGWNLVATGNNITPSQFNANLKASLLGSALTTLWAWDNATARGISTRHRSKRKAGRRLPGYIASKGYLDFSPPNKTLGNGTGFWVNRPYDRLPMPRFASGPILRHHVGPLGNHRDVRVAAALARWRVSPRAPNPSCARR